MKRYLYTVPDLREYLRNRIDSLLKEINDYASQYGLIYRVDRNTFQYKDYLDYEISLYRIPFRYIVLEHNKLKSLLVPDIWDIIEHKDLRFWYNADTNEITEPALTEPNWGPKLTWKQMVDITAEQIDQFRIKCDQVLQYRRKRRRGRKAKNETLHT